MIDLGRGCSRHRPVLVDFVDRGEVRAGTAAALAHLDRCARCTDAIEHTMLAITAMRRLGDDAARVEPADDAWPRLRLRIRSWRRRPAVMSPLAGAAMSFAIVAVLILPVHIVGTGVIDPTIAATYATDTSANPHDRLIETAYLANSRRQSTTIATGGSVPLNIPPEIRQVRKEVHSAKPSGRPLEPI